MCFDDVRPGMRYLTYNKEHKTLVGTNQCLTFQSYPYIDEEGYQTFIAKSTGSVFGVYLADNGIIPHAGFQPIWNKVNFSVKVEEASIKEFHGWLLNEVRDTKSADALKAEFHDWFQSVKTEPYTIEASTSTNQVRIEIVQLDDKTVVYVNGVIYEQR